MVEMEGLDLKDSSLSPLNLERDITPRGSKVSEILIHCLNFNFSIVEQPRAGRTPDLSLPPAGSKAYYSCGAEGKESAQDGPDWTIWYAPWAPWVCLAPWLIILLLQTLMSRYTWSIMARE